MSFLSQAVAIVQTIYAGFFAWMPFSMQIAFGGIMAVSVVLTVIRLIGTVKNAIPFL